MNLDGFLYRIVTKVTLKSHELQAIVSMAQQSGSEDSKTLIEPGGVFYAAIFTPRLVAQPFGLSWEDFDRLTEICKHWYKASDPDVAFRVAQDVVQIFGELREEARRVSNL